MGRGVAEELLVYFVVVWDIAEGLGLGLEMERREGRGNFILNGWTAFVCQKADIFRGSMGEVHKKRTHIHTHTHSPHMHTYVTTYKAQSYARTHKLLTHIQAHRLYTHTHSLSLTKTTSEHQSYYQHTAG